MTVARGKMGIPLNFEITAPLGMELSKGDARLIFENELSPSLHFTICPSKRHNGQRILLVPKGDQILQKTSRLLSSRTKGSLSFVTRGLAITEEPSDVPTSTIGTLSHGPEYRSASYGHDEYYHIEINLNEKDFNQIRDIFLSGKLPSWIMISTPDIKHGNAPDGSEKLWEVYEANYSAVAKITGFSLAFSMDILRVGIGLKKTENEEENEREEAEKVKTAILHSREDIQLLCLQMGALNNSFSGLRKQVNILISVAFVIAVISVLYFRF